MKETMQSIFNDFWPTAVIFVFIVSLIRILYIKKNNRKFVFYKEFLSFMFIIYLLLLFQLVTYKEIEYSGLNLTPFREILRYSFNSYSFYKQILGNIILFLPLGYFISYYVKGVKLPTILLSSFFISVVIEGVQYFIGRCFDIDDIILNVVGGLIGYALFNILNYIKNHLPSALQKNYFYSLISIILIIFIVIYLLGLYNIKVI